MKLEEINLKHKDATTSSCNNVKQPDNRRLPRERCWRESKRRTSWCHPI